MTDAHDELAVLDRFRGHLPDVLRYIEQHGLRHCWPELSAVLQDFIDRPLPPYVILPLASCAAVGGAPHEAIPGAAVWAVLNVGIRILDDLQDQDHPGGLWTQVGDARAFLYSAALYALCNQLLVEAPWSHTRYRTISAAFTRDILYLAAGQDQDLRGQTRTLQDYWSTVAGKNGRAFAMACGMGGLCGTHDEALVNACRQYGFQLGIGLQLFDDFEGIWESGDLESGRITLPLLYAANQEHELATELRHYVETDAIPDNAARIRAILDALGAREFMVWAALQARQQALDTLAPLSAGDGVVALTAYINALYADVEILLAY